jgi:hypothetical protein
MEPRRGLSTIVAAVAVVIAVLGTSVYFLQSDSLSALFGNLARGDQEPVAQESPQEPVQQEVQDAAVQSVPEPEQAAQEPECKALTLASQPLASADECIEISDVRVWVNEDGSTATINERSTTAFVIENTGAKTVTVASIYLRSVPVPVQDWHHTKDAQAIGAVAQHGLEPDYKEGVVLVGGSLAIMEQGAITLEQGQKALVYLNEAGGLTEKDAGLSLVLQVQTANVQAITQVSVVSSRT